MLQLLSVPATEHRGKTASWTVKADEAQVYLVDASAAQVVATLPTLGRFMQDAGLDNSNNPPAITAPTITFVKMDNAGAHTVLVKDAGGTTRATLTNQGDAVRIRPYEFPSGTTGLIIETFTAVVV